ncbi:MAG TPA: HD-GYP domain-containing protein [Thermoanaerobaculia bacterium]|nr:HD-GYP domain-containing protein [Thermoanaerobaculia bacterium]
MNVFSPENRAAPAGAAYTWRREHPLLVWLGRGRGVRLGTTLVVGFLGALLPGLNATAPLLPLPLSPFVSFVSGLAFGWIGILGSAVGQLAMVWILQKSFLTALVLSVSFALSGIAGWLVFRFAPGLGRGLPNLRSFLSLLGSALLGGLAGSVLLWMAGFPVGGSGVAIWLWNRLTGGVMSVLLLGIPVLLALDRWGRRFLVPIPGEVPARKSRGVDAEGFGSGEETVILAPPPRREEIGRELLLGAGMILGVTALSVPFTRLIPEGAGWITLLYLGPILWAAFNRGLRGGVLAASGSGLAYLLGLAWMAAAAGAAGAERKELWANRGDLLILSVGAALVGWSREREIRVRDELVETNRLLRRDLLRVTRALTQAVEAKDAYTEGHLRRVSEYAVSVGEKLGLRGQDLETLHHASLLHDIGKIGIPEEVLRKEGPLTPQEIALMRRHPEIGARMLEKLDVLNDAAPLVLHHQERFDGVRSGHYPGYPGGLAGDAIPLGARIIAVVDAFDAMTTDRPYRAALPVEDAVAVLRRERGKQFDPRVVDAFLDSLAERPWSRD